VLYTKNVNDEKTQEFIKRQGFDLGVCAFFNQIFSEKSLNAQQKTILNLHPSLHPRNKGVDPTFYRRLRQEDSSGISLHKISPEIDAGHLISQSKVPIKPKQSLLMETYQHFKYGSTLLVETLNESTFKSITQSANSPTNYDSWPTATLAKKVKNLVSVTDFISILKELFHAKNLLIKRAQ
jgi:methionyl-tRNA formyltransferase